MVPVPGKWGPLQMKHENILAHRGYWKTLEEKNADSAIIRALEMGFGLETDIRDLDGVLVVSHDMPISGACSTFDWLLKQYTELGAKGLMALNIKADGLSGKIAEMLTQYGISAAFAFDMSVPDTLGYRVTTTDFYSRISEYEPSPALFGDCAGVWVDNFSGDYDQIGASTDLLNKGKKVAFVSPELHKRDHENVWSDIKAAGLHKDDRFALCTDFPEQALAFFEGE